MTCIALRDMTCIALCDMTLQCHVAGIFSFVCDMECGPGSSDSIATGYWSGRSGDRIPMGARFSAPIHTGPGAHPASCTIGTGSFPGVKGGRGVTLNPHTF